MSWSGSKTFQRTNPGQDQVEIESIIVSGQDYAQKERDEQVQAAKLAAQGLLAVPGIDTAAWVGVILSGHANPGHEPSAGSPEAITVSVFVARPPA